MCYEKQMEHEMGRRGEGEFRKEKRLVRVGGYEKESKLKMAQKKTHQRRRQFFQKLFGSTTRRNMAPYL
jgi:hypothetical protein